jgi:hypothetical protein
MATGAYVLLDLHQGLAQDAHAFPEEVRIVLHLGLAQQL